MLQYLVEINLRASEDVDYSDLVPKINKLLEGTLLIHLHMYLFNFISLFIYIWVFHPNANSFVDPGNYY